MDEEDQVMCMVCGVIKRELNYHLRAKHGMSKDEYMSAFPGARIISITSSARKSSAVSNSRKYRAVEVTEETRRKLSERSKAMHARMRDEDPDAYLARQQQLAADARAAKGKDYRHSEETKSKMRGPRPAMKGREFSETTRAKIAEARRKVTGWTHKPETIEKMKDAWVRRREDKEAYAAYVASVSDRMRTPENRTRLQKMMAERIINGVHNGKSKDTTLEKRFAKYLTLHNIRFEKQHQITDGGGGVFLVDFYLPDMNMLVEVDGEWWHRLPEQFNRDKIKERLILASGRKFVRISDHLWTPEIILADEEAIALNNEIVLLTRSQNLRPARQPIRR